MNRREFLKLAGMVPLCASGIVSASQGKPEECYDPRLDQDYIPLEGQGKLYFLAESLECKDKEWENVAKSVQYRTSKDHLIPICPKGVTPWVLSPDHELRHSPECRGFLHAASVVNNKLLLSGYILPEYPQLQGAITERYVNFLEIDHIVTCSLSPLISGTAWFVFFPTSSNVLKILSVSRMVSGVYVSGVTSW